MDKIREALIDEAFGKWAHEPGTEEEEKIWEKDDYDFSRVTFRAGYLAALSAPVASDARELVYTIWQIVTQGSGTYWAAREDEAAAEIERFAAERERKAREEIAALRAYIKTMDDNRMWPDEVHGVATTALSDAGESAEPAEERGPEVDALLWMAEHLMGSSAASTMRGWLAEYRATGKLVVRDADGTVKDSLTVASKERQ